MAKPKIGKGIQWNSTTHEQLLLAILKTSSTRDREPFTLVLNAEAIAQEMGGSADAIKQHYAILRKKVRGPSSKPSQKGKGGGDAASDIGDELDDGSPLKMKAKGASRKGSLAVTPEIEHSSPTKRKGKVTKVKTEIGEEVAGEVSKEGIKESAAPGEGYEMRQALKRKFEEDD